MPPHCSTQILLTRNFLPVSTAAQLRSLFASFGLIRQVWLSKTKNHGSSNLAFVEFVFPEDAAKAAQEMDGFGTGGTLLEVKQIRKILMNGREVYCYLNWKNNESNSPTCSSQNESLRKLANMSDGMTSVTHLLKPQRGTGTTVVGIAKNDSNERNDTSVNQLPTCAIQTKMSHYRKRLMSQIPRMNILEIMDRLELVNRMENSNTDQVSGQVRKESYRNFLNLLTVVEFPFGIEQPSSPQRQDLTDFVDHHATSPSASAQP